jgi:energy-coupling factor transport system substrate-specific component
MVGINLASGFIVQLIRLPIFLDSIGIILGALLAGPLVAAIIGVLTTLIGSIIIVPILWAYTGTAIAIALTAALLAKLGMFRSAPRAILSGLIIAVVAALASAPVTVLAFGGATASGVTVLTAIFREMGHSLWKSTLASGSLSELIDKSVAALLAFTLARSLPNRVLALFPGARARVGQAS